MIILSVIKKQNHIFIKCEKNPFSIKFIDLPNHERTNHININITNHFMQ